MRGKDRTKLRQRQTAGLWFVVTLAIESVLRPFLESSWVNARPVVKAAGIVIAVVVGVVGGFKMFAAYRRKKLDREEARATGRWPSGRPHVLTVDAHLDSSRTAATIVFETGGLRVDPAPELLPDVIAFADVQSVRVRSTCIEVQTRAWTFRVFPADYEDRQRLLWEFALHCNAAMERGIDEETGKERSRAEALKPAPVASATDDPPRPAATDSANLDGLDRGMTSLGSALAGPAHRPNPAPPKRSGLGVGLFPLPDGDGT